MDPDRFISDRAGKLVSVGGRYNAFVPHSLPPTISYSPALVARLSEADQALGGINQLSTFIPNPRLMMMPMVGVEAISSSKIEGTVTTVDEVFRAQMRDGDESQSLQEVLNYLTALELGAEAVREAALDVDLVKRLHYELLRGARGSNKHPGELRPMQVYVGSSYVPPPPRFLEALVTNWEDFLRNTTSSSPLVQCAVMHVQFEMIHPFVDGNGRLGRLLMTLLFIKRGCLREPLLFLSTYFERHRDEYYQRLLAVSQRGDWEGWIDFFCRAVKSQADYGIRTANSLNELRNELRRVALNHTSSRVVPAAVDLLFEHPYINSGMLAERLQVSPAGARNTLATLEKLGIVEETTGFKRNRVFCAERILAVIREAENPSLANEQPQLEFE